MLLTSGNFELSAAVFERLLRLKNAKMMLVGDLLGAYSLYAVVLIVNFLRCAAAVVATDPAPNYASIQISQLKTKRAFESYIFEVQHKFRQAHLDYDTVLPRDFEFDEVWDPKSDEPTEGTELLDSAITQAVSQLGSQITSDNAAMIAPKFFMRAIDAIFDKNSYIYQEGNHYEYMQIYKVYFSPTVSIPDRILRFISIKAFEKVYTGEENVSVLAYRHFVRIVLIGTLNYTKLTNINLFLKDLMKDTPALTDDPLDLFEHHQLNVLMFTVYFKALNTVALEAIFDESMVEVPPDRSTMFAAFENLYSDSDDTSTTKGQAYLFSGMDTSQKLIPLKSDNFKITDSTPEFQDATRRNFQRFFVDKINLAKVLDDKSEFTKDPADIKTIISDGFFAPDTLLKYSYVPQIGEPPLDPKDAAQFTAAHEFFKNLLLKEDHQWKLPEQAVWNAADATAMREGLTTLFIASQTVHLRYPFTQTEYLLFVLKNMFSLECIYLPASILFKPKEEVNSVVRYQETLKMEAFEKNQIQNIVTDFRKFFNANCQCYNFHCGAVLRRFMIVLPARTTEDYKKIRDLKIAKLYEYFGHESSNTSRMIMEELFWSFSRTGFGITRGNHFWDRNPEYLYRNLRLLFEFFKFPAQSLFWELFEVTDEPIRSGSGLMKDGNQPTIDSENWIKIYNSVSATEIESFLSNTINTLAKTHYMYMYQQMDKDSFAMREAFDIEKISEWISRVNNMNFPLIPNAQAMTDLFNTEFKKATSSTESISLDIFSKFAFPLLQFYASTYRTAMKIPESVGAAKDFELSAANVATVTNIFFTFLKSRAEFSILFTEHTLRVVNPNLTKENLHTHKTILSGVFDINNYVFWLNVDTIILSLFYSDVEMSQRKAVALQDQEMFALDSEAISIAESYSYWDIYGLQATIKDSLTPQDRLKFLTDEHNHMMYSAPFITNAMTEILDANNEWVKNNPATTRKVHLWIHLAFVSGKTFSSSSPQQDQVFKECKDELVAISTEKLGNFTQEENNFTSRTVDCDFNHVPLASRQTELIVSASYHGIAVIRGLESIETLPYSSAKSKNAVDEL